jgi:hypothetical protein
MQRPSAASVSSLSITTGSNTLKKGDMSPPDMMNFANCECWPQPPIGNTLSSYQHNYTTQLKYGDIPSPCHTSLHHSVHRSTLKLGWLTVCSHNHDPQRILHVLHVIPCRVPTAAFHHAKWYVHLE